MKKFLALFALTAVFMPACAQSYHAEVTLRRDGLAVVKETFTLPYFMESLERKYPAVYQNGSGLGAEQSFDILSVRVGGQPAVYDKFTAGADEEISIKRPAKESKEVTYEISYQTFGLMRFYSDSDEMYLNALAYPADFKLDRVSAVINLPRGAEDYTVNVFAGRDGAVKRAAARVDAKDHVYSFTLDNPLKERETLIIAANIPKGFITPPKPADKKLNIRLYSVLGLGALLLYYLAVWLSLGVYTRKNITWKTTAAPQNLTPASVRYLYKKIPGQVADKYKSLLSTVLGLSVKGGLKIEKNGGEYSLVLKDKNKAATKEERLIIKALFTEGDDVFHAKNTPQRVIDGLRAALRAVSREELSKYFRSNKRWLITGWVLSGIYAALVLVLAWHRSTGYALLFAAAGLFISFVFSHLLNPFNAAGKEVMAEVEAFRTYLMSRPEEEGKEDIKVFETLLPYAVALGVENKWCRCFARQLEQMHSRGASFTWFESDSPAPENASYVGFFSTEIGRRFLKSFAYAQLNAEAETKKTEK